MPQDKKHPWTFPRANPRFLLDVRLVVRAKGTLFGRTKDIAEGGLGATIPGNLDVGDIVELELHMPETSETLKLIAEVRYSQGFQYGFKFLHATVQQREIIRRTTRALLMAP